MTTLIVSDPWDVHARSVAWALENEGERVHIWYTHDYPQKHHVSLRTGGGAAATVLHCLRHERDFDTADIDAVWLRRWYQPESSSQLHPADTRFAQIESTEFVRATINLLDEQRERFWINPVRAKSRADRKAVQLHHAAAVGLDTPPTLISNDPAAIRAFFHEHGGQAIYKPITAASWVSEEKAWATYTTALSEDLLREDASLSNAPGIYQPLLDKAYELRVTIMGRTVIPARLHSQREGHYLTDWRANDFDEAMGCERYPLPEAVEARCLQLMARLGLVFGCIDIVVTRDGRYVFLEVNEMGQFLWLEAINPGLQLLDGFVHFIRSRDPAFVYDWREPAYRYRDYWESRGERGEAEPDEQRHVPLPRVYQMRE
ncbi:glutathione synthase/RimK-type ligase-like ATP-grasp enzyme [Lysobacter enzymogenes]|uniref:MvdC/MvdD family ATP grasp protein n=1 Tax=Lysobacter enzymogenes TaxID=69 RepID=UPI003393D572